MQSRSLVLVVSLLSAACAAQAQPVKVNPDAQALKAFDERVNAYVKLLDRAETGAPPLKETTEPEKIVAAQRARAERIRAARADAKPGDIFTPDAQQALRRAMYPALKGPDAPENKGTIKEDAPTEVPLRVNGDYPQTAPLATMPPDLLARLPRLPKPLEYRVISRHLVLLDTSANLIVDFYRNAIR